jgi:pimeloyl-ACP methyl ester carboxylesterase
VLDGYRIDNAHVVGASMGDILGQLLALDYRDRLHTLTRSQPAELSDVAQGCPGAQLA